VAVGECLERGAVAEGGVQPLAVVEDLDVLGDANRARARVAKVCRWSSRFRAAKKLSAAALSQHPPVRPTLVRTRLSVQNWAN
jgi:hypothetical protein